MVANSNPSIQIDLNEFKLHLQLKGQSQLTLHFNSPSRIFYLSVIALVVNEMKKSGKIKSIPLQEHLDLLALLNETVGGAAGSSEKENLLSRTYRKWKDALPNLEEAPLFKVQGKRKKEEGDGAIGKVYSFTDAEKDGWANLFDYMGSEENVRLKFAIDKIGVGLNETSIIFQDFRNGEAWDQFIAGLREVAPVERMKFPLPDEPSIAVLPFVNMSEDPKQELLCDGIAEAIITAFSWVPRMFVIARNSTFTYKGKAVKVKQVSEELGVRYVLEGSVQRSGDRIRINARLIDALSGHQLWAEHYDREVKDLFSVQDELTLKIIKAMQVKLTEGESPFVTYAFKGSQNLECYLKAIEALKHLERQSLEGVYVARRLAMEVLSLCPEHVLALNLLGFTYYSEWRIGTTKSPKESLEKAIELAQEVIKLDDGYAWGHFLLAYCYLAKSDHDRAIYEAERAVALNPGSADMYSAYADILTYSGRPEEAIPLAKKAIRLNPFCPAYYFTILGIAYRCAGQFEEAVSAYKKALQRWPDNLFAQVGLTAAYSQMGREKEALAQAAEVLRINPHFSSDHWAKAISYKDQSQRDNLFNALRKAGLK